LAVSLIGCEKPQARPEESPPLATLAATATAAPAGSSPSEVGGTAKPPEPGKVDLELSGAHALVVRGEGVECELEGDGFWLRSNDLVGVGSKPRWVLVLSERKLQFQLGPFGENRTFDSKPEIEAELVRRGEVFRFDHDLFELRGKGTVHIKGAVTCAKAATGPVPDAIAAILRSASGAPLRDHSTQDFGRERLDSTVSVLVPEEAGRDVVRAVRKQLPAGWVVFIGTTRWLGDERGNRGKVEVVVGPGRDQFDILRLAKTDAINHEMTTEAIVKKLRAYHALGGIEIWHAETDTVQADLVTLPADMKAFSEDVYAFCPDIVDQGTATVAALEKEMAKTKTLYLWWD